MRGPIVFRAALYFAIAFLSPFAEQVSDFLSKDQWPSTQRFCLAIIIGLIAGLTSLRAYFDGSAERARTTNNKTMKPNTILALCICAGLALGMTGCKTVTDSTGASKKVLDVTTTKAVIAAVVPTVVSLAVVHDENCKPYLAIASATIRAAVATNSIDPATITSQFEVCSAKELRTDEAKVAVTAAIGIYRAAFTSVLEAKLSQDEYCVPILIAIADAIDVGLGSKSEVAVTTK